MTPRDDAEIRRSFHETAEILDDALSHVYKRGDVAIDDRSNRSGFDHTGFPMYTWSHTVRRETERDGCIVLTQVHFHYIEPGVAGKATPVECTVNAQIFLPGSLPFFTRTEKREQSVARLARGGLLDTARALLDEAAEWLPEWYRSAVDVGGDL